MFHRQTYISVTFYRSDHTLSEEDDRFADPRPLADLGNAETGIPTSACQGVADTHTIPPLHRRSPDPAIKCRHPR